jgi:hypothetical protein
MGRSNPDHQYLEFSEDCDVYEEEMEMRRGKPELCFTADLVSKI